MTQVNQLSHYLDQTEMQKRFKLSRSSLARAIENGEVPSPIRIGRLLRWHIKAVEQWEKEMIEECL